MKLKNKYMTHYEKTPLPLVVGDEVKHFDDGSDGHPIKWVNGKVTGIGDEGFEVQWEDLPWPTDYRWDGCYLKGDQIFDGERKDGLEEAKQEEYFNSLYGEDVADKLRGEVVFTTPYCLKCNPTYAANNYAPTVEGVYQCNCGHKYDIPTGKFLKAETLQSEVSANG